MYALAAKIKSKPALGKALLYGASFVFLIVCANAKVFLPISPVPVTFHTFAIAMMGALLPLRVSVPCFLAYLVEGLIGSPLLGMGLSFGPSFGYFVGMLVSLVFLNQAVYKRKLPLFASLAISSLIIWAFGVLHLQALVGIKTALVVGVVPFIIGDTFKLCLSYSLIKLACKKFEKA